MASIYPNRTKYLSAIRHPQIAFRNLDPELAAGKPVEIQNSQGMTDLWFAAGGFACVFKYETYNPNKRWAVRCFLQSTSSVANHYSKVSSSLQNVSCSSYFVNFQFQDRGIMVDGDFYPIVKMEWVEGNNLKDFIKDNLQDKSKLNALAKAWVKLSKDLLDAGISHGDLQHGNILVDDSNGIDLKLIDYDSLYFSVDGNSINDEIKGVAGYQHPLRETLQKQCMEIDFFPQLVIYLSILAIAKKPQLWNTYDLDNKERLLFSLADFQNPDQSQVFNDLSKLSSDVSTLAGKLKQICKLTDFSKISSLDILILPTKWKPKPARPQPPIPTSPPVTTSWDVTKSQPARPQPPIPTSPPVTTWDVTKSQPARPQPPTATSPPVTTWDVTKSKPPIIKPPITQRRPIQKNVMVKAIAIVSTITAITLGGFCYYQYEKIQLLQIQYQQRQKNHSNADKEKLQQVEQLTNKRDELQSRLNELTKYTYVNFCNKTTKKKQLVLHWHTGMEAGYFQGAGG